MKITAAVSLALVGSVFAAGAADTVNQVLTQVASDLKDFDAAIKAYAGDTTKMMAASKKIEQTTTKGASDIAAGSDLTLSDAVGITSNVQGLQATLDGALSDLKAISDKLAAAGQCKTILDNLQSQSKAAAALQEAITSKAPAETKAVAQQLGGAIGAAIQDTATFFKQACAGAPSTPPAGSSGGQGGMAGHDMGSMGGSGGSGGSSSSSGSSGSSGASGSPGASGSSGSKTNKEAKTPTAAKPATYTGAANVLTAPFIGALALAVFAL
jgi:hypothetical protein